MTSSTGDAAVVAVGVVVVGEEQGGAAGPHDVVGAVDRQDHLAGEHVDHLAGAAGVGVGVVAVARGEGPVPQLEVVALVGPDEQVADAATRRSSTGARPRTARRP